MRIILISILALFFSLDILAAGAQVQINQVGDSVHLEFKGLQQWDYNIDKSEEKDKTQIKMEVPKLSEPALMAIKEFKSSFVESIQVIHNGVDGKDNLIFKFSQGNLDSFDYLTDQPSRLIVDIFLPKENTKKTVKQVVKPPPLPKKSNEQNLDQFVKEDGKTGETKVDLAASKKSGGTETSRKPSSADALEIKDQGGILAQAGGSLKFEGGIYDGGDPDFKRFMIKDYEIKEGAIIASKRNYYLEFPMLKMENHQLEKLNTAKPIYEISTEENDENRQARLLKTLFDNKRYLVFLKTVEWFYEKYPNSKYDEVIRFMWADVNYELWSEKRNVEHFDQAMLRYKQAIDKYPNSPLLERTLMLMGFASMERGDYLGSLRLFQNHVKTRPASPNRDISRFAIAEAYLKLNRFEDAFNTLDELEKESSQKKYSMRAAYLKGDIFYKSGKFNNSIEEYNRAIKKFPEGTTEYPNAYYNQASAFFNLGKPVESLNAYIAFLKRFPSHEYAGFAMTRVGEVLEILGADKSRSLGAYLETHFRYGDKPGSVVAQLRLLSERMKMMKPKEVEKAVTDIMALAQKSELARIDQFATVLIAEGYSNRSDFDKSIDLLVKYYQENPTTADTGLLKNRIVKYINMKFQDQVDSGQYIEALKTHKKYADSWLKTSDRIDTKYNVGRAHEQIGVLSEADKMYRDSLNKILAIRGSKDEKEANIFEKLPSTDELYLRLSQVYLQQAKLAESYENLKQIKDPEKLSEVQQIERVQIAASLLEKRGDSDSAIRHLVELIKTWRGVAYLVAEPYFTLGNLELKAGKIEDAKKSYQRVDQLIEDSNGKVSSATHIKALENIAQIEMDKGNQDQALVVYQKLLEKYEKTKPMESTRYRVGQIYYSRGEIQKAAEAWDPLKDRKNSFWHKMAQEQLQSSNWNSEYKKYIQRIPAMSERK